MSEKASFNHYRYSPRVIIGESEIAALIAVGCGEKDLKTAAINYGGDSRYMAYICDERTGIPGYYRLVFTCDSWLKIYDDTGLAFDSADYAGEYNHFTIYRSGDYGTIIQMRKVEGKR